MRQGKLAEWKDVECELSGSSGRCGLPLEEAGKPVHAAGGSAARGGVFGSRLRELKKVVQGV